MQTLPLAGNPFALMLDPEAVLRAIDCSDRLARLKSQVCRPLDKPLIARRDASMAAFDDAIDDDLDAELDD
jgi:hypothetical protein